MKKNILSTTTNINASLGILILRIGAGILILTHGVPKFMKLLDGNLQFADPLGLGSEITFIFAVFAEFLCGVLVLIGLYTRIAVIPLIITMLTAAIIVHSTDPFGVKEKPLLFAVIFLALLFTGSGKYSIDKKIL